MFDTDKKNIYKGLNKNISSMQDFLTKKNYYQVGLRFMPLLQEIENARGAIWEEIYRTLRTNAVSAEWKMRIEEYDTVADLLQTLKQTVEENGDKT